MNIKKALQDFKNLKEILSPMTPKQRIEYLVTYYSFLLIPVVVLIVIIVIIHGAVSKKEPVMTGFGVNVTLTEEATAYVTEQWLDTQGYNPKKQTAIFSYVVGNESYTGEGPIGSIGDRIASAATMSISAHVSARALEYMLVDDGTLEELNPLMFADLRTILNAQQLSELEPYFVEVTAEGNTFPGAINISHTQFASNCGHLDDNLYILFISNTPYADVCDEFLDYLLAWQP